MKKVFCMSFLLFATTLCFATTTAKTDKVSSGSEITGPTSTSDMPWPEPGCPNPPGSCPGDPKGN
jgi:hypothetical protein